MNYPSILSQKNFCNAFPHNIYFLQPYSYFIFMLYCNTTSLCWCGLTQSPACSFAHHNIRYKAFQEHPKEDNKDDEGSRREYVSGMNSWIVWPWTLLTVIHPGHHQPRSWGILCHSASCIYLIFGIYTHFWDIHSNLSFKDCFFLGTLLLVPE